MGVDGAGRGRHWWRLAAVVCVAVVVASVAYAVWQVGHGGLSAGDTAGVLGVPVGVAGLAAALAALRRPREGTEADLALGQARSLARLVAEGEGRVLAQLLGADIARINLRYDLVLNPVRAAWAPAAGLGVEDPVVPLPDIAAYYRDTRPARLVVTGAPGAGKTVLALQLLLALATTRAETDPVPLRVPLAQWDTSTPLRQVLVQRLVDTYNLPWKVAVNLVAHGLVLPVFDGLDEMDPTLPDGRPDPAAPRARAALNQLSAYQDAGNAAPLVLVCRSAHYDALATADLLLDAARIALAPVDPSPAVAYLASRARDLPRWQPLLDHLRDHPGSVHAALLSTPWRLGLTATVYHRTGDPAELLVHTGADTLDDHLLARYITAATLAATDANPRGYTPHQIHQWLHHLAAHLAPTPWTPARTDIALTRLWPMAGPTRVRVVESLLTTLVVLLPFLLAWPLHIPFAVSFLCAVIAPSAGMGRGMVKKTNAMRVDVRRLATRAGRRQWAAATAFGLMGGLMSGLTVGLIDRLLGGPMGGTGTGLIVGLTFGPAFGLGFLLTARQSAAARPGRIISGSMQLGLTLGPLAGLAFGLLTGLLGGLASGLMLGLASGLMFGLTTGDASWRYLVFLLCVRGRVPFRLARFLDWGCEVGLMRYSGPAYQFRHRELQLWLADHPGPVP